MGDDDDSPALFMCYARKQPRNLGPARRVERRGRFVGEDDVGFSDGGPCNRDPLLFAAAELVGVGAFATFESQVSQNPTAGLLDSESRLALKFKSQGDILPRAQRRQQIVMLKDKSQAIASQPA